MSQSQFLTELAKVRWNGNPKEYTDQFAAVAERGVGLTPEELADYYCTGLPTNLHLLMTNNRVEDTQHALVPARENVPSVRGRPLVTHCPLLPDLVPQGADPGWLPIRNAAGNPTEDYEENFIMGQRGSAADVPGPRQVARNP
ncbi:hypothetical protein ENH_00011870 [Eimeria necatrix]|uniref:Uncharacterized protein n=1 Tax=Eimeria necatrix TaxID=51315 RepID=U6MTW0_9EIME|nr:hypothetical protein ENH_00011870 [Eimeria necatrix]CDJ65909.1 hypothetical protein ENH_00011870 [Eimeria necatrix]